MSMRGILHRSFVWLLAISFIASGATWRQCAAAPAIPAMSQQAAQKDVQENLQEHLHGHGAHAVLDHQMTADHTAHHAGSAEPAQSPRSPDDHACKKCCGMCSVASVMPAVPFATAIPVTRAIFFTEGSHTFSSSAPQLDPGIPIRLS